MAQPVPAVAMHPDDDLEEMLYRFNYCQTEMVGDLVNLAAGLKRKRLCEGIDMKPQPTKPSMASVRSNDRRFSPFRFHIHNLLWRCLNFKFYSALPQSQIANNNFRRQNTKLQRGHLVTFWDRPLAAGVGPYEDPNVAYVPRICDVYV